MSKPERILHQESIPQAEIERCERAVDDVRNSFEKYSRILNCIPEAKDQEAYIHYTIRRNDAQIMLFLLKQKLSELKNG